MTTDDKIRDEKLQYYINREVAHSPLGKALKNKQKRL